MCCCVYVAVHVCVVVGGVRVCVAVCMWLRAVCVCVRARVGGCVRVCVKLGGRDKEVKIMGLFLRSHSASKL